jgi:AP2 domain
MPVSRAQAQANPLRNIQRIDVGHHTWRVVTMVAYWQNANGKRCVRSFNVSKYGEEGAKQLAIRAD